MCMCVSVIPLSVTMTAFQGQSSVILLKLTENCIDNFLPDKIQTLYAYKNLDVGIFSDTV